MLGPSGFFLPNKPEGSPSDSDTLELIHTSKDGFNQLYRGCKNGRFFVYKALKEEYRGNFLYEELLKKDFNIGFSLSHTGICQYYAMIDHPSAGNCIVMEWIDGCSLESLMQEGRIDSGLAEKIICEICDALDYIHRKQIIRRDLKPENIMVTHNGSNVKIIDFGLSDTDSYNTFKSPAGTKAYASPELINGEVIDIRSDIWSLGIIINELSRKYKHVSQKCIRRDRAERYASASEVKNDVMRNGKRKLFIWISAICISVVLIIAGILYAGRDNVPAEPDAVPDVTSTPIEDSVPKEPSYQDEPETSEGITQPQTKEQKPETKANLDADDLEDLFNAAAQQIL